MCYLESLQLVHRDLAARNVLLDAHLRSVSNVTSHVSLVTCYTVLCLLRAKVADFGLTMKDNMKVSEEKPAMAVLWSAPEAIGNILQILTQLILCLDFTRAANDP